MDLQKICIALLALLLAAMVIVPLVSADDSMGDYQRSLQQDEKINESTQRMGPEFSVKNVEMTKEEFLKANAELITFLLKTNDKATVDKMMDDEYHRAYGKKVSTASVITPKAINDIVQVGGYDIFIWPYSNTGMTRNAYSGSVNLIFYGMSKSQVASYVKSSTSPVYSDAIGFTEYGYRGASSGSMSWTTTSSYDQLQYGDYYTTRYHLILFDGGYSSSLGKNWCYGQTHYEWWSWAYPPGHYMGGNAFNAARTFFYQAMNGAKPWTYPYVYSDDPGFADGYAYAFRMA